MPEKHNKVRKLKNLFNNCIETYRLLKKMGDNINPVVSITVTHENCDNIKEIFNYLHKDCGIDAIKCTLVRDEGVYKTPIEKKKKILQAYEWLTNEIKEKMQSKEIVNYNSNSIRTTSSRISCLGKWLKMCLDPKYISPCHAGSLFGIISSKGKVLMRILENKELGDLRKMKWIYENLEY